MARKNPLIRGDKLNARQRQEVLSAFGYRWTKDNERREDWWHGIKGKPRIPLISDAQWLREHAFHFTKDGSRLVANKRHAEPAFLAENPRKCSCAGRITRRRYDKLKTKLRKCKSRYRKCRAKKATAWKRMKRSAKAAWARVRKAARYVKAGGWRKRRNPGMYQVELVWNREFNFVKHGPEHDSLDKAIKYARRMEMMGDGAAVKKTRIVDENDVVVWQYGKAVGKNPRVRKAARYVKSRGWRKRHNPRQKTDSGLRNATIKAFNRIDRAMRRYARGTDGLRYGWDMPTANALFPELVGPYMKLREEYKARGLMKGK